MNRFYMNMAPAQAVTGHVWMHETCLKNGIERDRFGFHMPVGQLDAPEFIPAGSVANSQTKAYPASTTMIFRGAAC